MRLVLDLDSETTRRLTEESLSERRPLNLEAEVLLRRALRLPFPLPVAPNRAHDPPDTSDGSATPG